MNSILPPVDRKPKKPVDVTMVDMVGFVLIVVATILFFLWVTE